MRTKIGLLLPRSDMFPSLALDFIQGLKLLLNNSNNSLTSFEYIIEGIGNATDDSVNRIAEKMILQENVDLTISFCGIFKLNELVTTFNSYKKPLIHIDVGGNVFKKEHVSEYVLHHTLNLCQSTYASGVYAAKNFGKNAALAISFYDGGYHLTESFVKGFTENGGNIVYNYVGPMDYKSETFETMILGIENSKPDVVFGLFSYKEASKVFEIISNSKLNGKMPFVVIPLMTDEIVNTKNYGMQNVYSISSWSFHDDSVEMKNFKSFYQEKYENSPNIFSLLGYETGLLITKSLNPKGKIPLKVSESVKFKKIQTPRGELTFNNFNESQITQFKLREFIFINTNYQNKVIETIDASISESLNEKFKEFPLSGWKNPYICT